MVQHVPEVAPEPRPAADTAFTAQELVQGQGGATHGEARGGEAPC